MLPNSPCEALDKHLLIPLEWVEVAIWSSCWMSISVAHTQAIQAYTIYNNMNNMQGANASKYEYAQSHANIYDAMNEWCLHKYKRVELRVIGSIANTQICFEVRAPSSTSPPTPPCRISQSTIGVPNSSLNRTKPPRLYNHNPPLPKRDTARSQIQQPPLPKRLTNQSQYHSDHLYRRGIHKSKEGLQQVVPQPQTSLFFLFLFSFSTQNKDPNNLG